MKKPAKKLPKSVMEHTPNSTMMMPPHEMRVKKNQRALKVQRKPR